MIPKTLEELGVSPAPWRAVRADTLPVFYVRNNGNEFFIAATAQGERMEADAGLMASSPALYDVCRRALMFEARAASNEQTESWGGIIRDMRSAVAAAGGESEVAK